MYASNRRLEYRSDILDTLSHRYAISSVTDLRKHASQSHYLEGTGSIVFDHLNKLAFAARSKRTSDKLLRKVFRLSFLCKVLRIFVSPFFLYKLLRRFVFAFLFYTNSCG